MAIYDQGTDSQAKPSTRYLARNTSVTALTADISQRLTNLTAGTSSVYENASARFNHAAPRTIGVRVSMLAADTGTLWRRNTAGDTERLAFSAANTIRATVAGATAVQLVVTAPTGSDICIVAWATEANPDTTGAGDAYRSRLMHWNVTDGTFAASDWTPHVAISTASATAAVFGADNSGGTTAFAGAMTACWFENRVQSGAEIANDWGSGVSAPTTSDAEGVHQGIPPQADTIDAVNNYAGPPMVIVADATRRMQRRTLSPLINECLTTSPTWTYALLVAADPMIRGAPDDSTYRLPVGLRRVAPIASTCTHAWVRIHVRSWATDANAVAVAFRMYSFSRIPGAVLPPEDQDGPDPLVSYYVGATVTRDDDAVPGQYTTLGLLPLARGRTGMYRGRTVLALGIACPSDAEARIQVRAIHVVPAFVDAAGGLDFGGVDV